MPQRVRELDDVLKQPRIVRRLRHPERFDRCRAEMSRHDLPHEIVRDVAVEHGAEESLVVAGQACLQAEQRMRRDDARRQDRRDQREAIGRARDVAIGKPGSRECGGGIEQARAAFRDSGRCGRSVWTPNGSMCFPSSTGIPPRPE